MFYWISAEHMSNMLLEEVVQGIDDQRRGNVYGYGMDSVHTGVANMLVEATPANVDAIQAMFHDQNGGAYCDVRLMCEEELEQYL
jgi:hypothetical protein